MSMGKEIVDHLQSLGLGTYEADLFLDELPDTPDVCAAVFETGGSPPDGGFGVDGIQYENPTVKIWFRGIPNDSAGPHAQIRQAYLELPKIQAQALGGVLYLTVQALQPPFILERDVRRRVVWAFNALAQKEPS